MLQDQKLTRSVGDAIAPLEKLQELLNQSIHVLESALDDQTLSTDERAAIALAIARLAHQSGPLTTSTLSRLCFNHKLNDKAATSEQQAVKPVHEPVPAIASSGQPNGNLLAVQSPQTQILRANYLQIDHFLPPEDHAQALAIALSKQPDFVASTTADEGVYSDYRRSLNLYATLFPEFYDLLKVKILKIFSQILRELRLPPFLISQVEMQMTAHNDGCYYKVHADSNSVDTATRGLTYVYYFHRQPKSFSGGELRLYDTELRANTTICHPSYKTIEPRNNSIVFFDSRYYHEVLPVHCPSQRFEDSRFTLNGWLRRADLQWSFALNKPLISKPVTPLKS
jgi:Rps23 Pro-64 3,4-dihydroxylase Tpa1-like proline 4-hydroxylase